MVFIDSLVGWASLLVGLSTLMPSSQVPYANIRVQFQSAVKGGNGPSDDGGHIPAISLRDTSDRHLGSYNPHASNPKKLQADSYWNRDIKSTRPSELNMVEVRMEYNAVTSLSGNTAKKSLDDGLCLAYMRWTPDSSMFNYAARAGAITGDLFYHCGYSWYHSGKKYGNYDLRCGWLDGDNSNGNSIYGMFINTGIMGSGYIEGFARAKSKPSDVCGWGVGFYTGSSPHRKRSTPASTYGNKAYVTAGGGAIELCDSPTSWGPSMLSLEQGVFCDMATKTKIPLCVEGKQETRCVEYKHETSSKRSLSPERTLQAQNVSSDDISFPKYELEYFTVSDVNGTLIDDGAAY